MSQGSERQECARDREANDKRLSRGEEGHVCRTGKDDTGFLKEELRKDEMEILLSLFLLLWENINKYIQGWEGE